MGSFLVCRNSTAAAPRNAIQWHLKTIPISMDFVSVVARRAHKNKNPIKRNRKMLYIVVLFTQHISRLTYL